MASVCLAAFLLLCQVEGGAVAEQDTSSVVAVGENCRGGGGSVTSKEQLLKSLLQKCRDRKMGTVLVARGRQPSLPTYSLSE